VATQGAVPAGTEGRKVVARRAVRTAVASWAAESTEAGMAAAQMVACTAVAMERDVAATGMRWVVTTGMRWAVARAMCWVAVRVRQKAVGSKAEATEVTDCEEEEEGSTTH